MIILPLLSCDGFLDEVDKDKLVPEKTDHYAALLLNEFNYEYPIFRTVDYMTDNVVENSTSLSSAKASAKTTFTWQREIEIDENGNKLGSINNSWEKMYEDIAISNYVIELIDNAIGDKNEIKFIKGEAYFIRALSYFNLLNLYGQPFIETSKNIDLGVPLRAGIGVEEKYDRNTVAEGYQFIENDLKLAIDLIDGSDIQKSIWHPNLASCYLLMSRVCLYQNKWNETVSWADKVISTKKLSLMYADRTFVSKENPEVLYSYNNVNPVFSTSTANGYRVNSELIDMYDTKDNRKTQYFATIDNGSGKITYHSKKYTPSFTTIGFTNLRVAEAYLNRAEAYAHIGENELALNDLKTLHSYRYSSTSGITYPTEPSQILSMVLKERRKELCFEDHHRWFDLRRMENRPVIKHKYSLVNDDGVKVGTETYTLLSNDYNYSLPIPLKERNNNPLIRNNDRYEKIPELENEIIIN